MTESIQSVTHDARAPWQDGFLDLMPRIVTQLRYAFRRLPSTERGEAIQEGIANALVAYLRLVKLGRKSLAYATPLAQYAVRQVREGRRVGGRLNAFDVMSPYCQRRRGVKVCSLSKLERPGGRWRDFLVEDRSSSPADLAAFKLDFESWLGQLTTNKRTVVEQLASGEVPSRVARLLHVSAARVSQLRDELRFLWDQFQGEAESTLSAGLPAASCA